MTLCVARSTCIRTVCERNHLWYIPRGQTRSGMVEMRIRQLKAAPQLVLLEMESSAVLLSVCGKKELFLEIWRAHVHKIETTKIIDEGIGMHKT